MMLMTLLGASGLGLRFRLGLFRALLFRLDNVEQLGLHRIGDHLRAPGFLARLDEVADQAHQLRVRLRLADRAEIFARIAHFIAEAQRPKHNSIVPRLQDHRPFAPVEDEPRHADHLGRAHGVANDAISLFANRIVGRQVVGRVVPDPVDALRGDETLDVDRAGALERDRFQLLVLEQDIVVLAARVAFDLVGLIDRLARFGVDIVALDSIAGPTVQDVEPNLVLFARRRHHRHRTGDEAELHVALPEWARGHRKVLPSTRLGAPTHRRYLRLSIFPASRQLAALSCETEFPRIMFRLCTIYHAAYRGSIGICGDDGASPEQQTGAAAALAMSRTAR